MNIYHYTNIDAVKSIIENQELWLTHVRYMNDSEELLHGAQMGLPFWLDSEREKHLEEKGTLDDFDANYWDLEHLNELARSLQFYVCSFCSEPDLLSQWRGYASAKGGYALEFNPESIKSVIEKVNSNSYGEDYAPITECHLKECIYKDDDKLTLLKPIIKKMVYGDNKGIGSERVLAVNEYFLAANKFKNIGFREEKEIRLIASVFFSTLNRHHRYKFFKADNGMLKPYVKLRIPPDCIQAIWVGPHPQQELAKDSLEQFLEVCIRKGHLSKRPTVRTSNIPLIA